MTIQFANLCGCLDRKDLVFKLAIYSATIMVSLALGMVSALSQPVLVLLLAGSLISIFLVGKPIVLMWLSTIINLMVAGTVEFFIPGMDKIWWIGYGIGILLFISTAYYHLINNKPKNIDESSLLRLPLLAFILMAVYSTLINGNPVWQILIASKSLLFLGGTWVALASYQFNSAEIKYWIKGIFLVGLIQLVPVAYQYLFVRTSRLAHGLGTVEASDSVVGTFGGSMTAGGLSSVLALFLVILIGGCLILYRSRILNKKLTIVYSLMLGAPLLLMEVKVIFVYLPIMLLFIYRDLVFKKPARFIVGMGLGGSVLLLVIFSYQFFHWSSSSNDFKQNVANAFSYSFKEKDYQDKAQLGEMTRREAIEFWWSEHEWTNPVTILFGHGMGASRTQGLGLGDVAMKYGILHIDMTGLSLILWDFGLAGTGAIFWILFSAYRQAGLQARAQHSESWQSSIATAVQLSILIITISIPYRNDVPYAAPMMFLLMATLGLQDWLKKQEGKVEKS